MHADLDHALCPDYNGDNAGDAHLDWPCLADHPDSQVDIGPFDSTKIAADWATIMGEFPNAEVRPSTFDAFFAQLQTVQDQLPVITEEIAGTRSDSRA